MKKILLVDPFPTDPKRDEKGHVVAGGWKAWRLAQHEWYLRNSYNPDATPQMMTRDELREHDYHRSNAKNAPPGTYRLTTQADWPKLYANLASVIRALRWRGGVWYVLDRKGTDGKWYPVVTRSESQGGYDYLGEDHS